MERNFTGKTVDDAIKAASEELGLSREDFTVEVLENPKSGFLGLGAKPAVIKVVYKNEVNAVEFVEDFLNGLMEKMGIMEYELKVTEPEEKSIRAVKVAKQVQKTKRKVTLSSMNSAKRRVIHSKLQDFENITTYSVGEEPNRRVVIAYKWPEGQEPPAEPERRPYPPKNGGGKKPYGKGGYGNKNGYRKPRRDNGGNTARREESPVAKETEE